MLPIVTSSLRTSLLMWLRTRSNWLTSASAVVQALIFHLRSSAVRQATCAPRLWWSGSTWVHRPISGLLVCFSMLCYADSSPSADRTIGTCIARSLVESSNSHSTSPQMLEPLSERCSVLMRVWEPRHLHSYMNLSWVALRRCLQSNQARISSLPTSPVASPRIICNTRVAS